MRVSSKAVVGFAFAIALIANAPRAVAQTTVHSFEGGVGAWGIQGSDSLASSMIGATDGTKSLQVTHLGGFVYLTDNFGFHDLWAAALPGAESLSFDITLAEGFAPIGGVNFLQTRIAFNYQGDYAESNDTPPTQPDVNIPLTVGTHTATFSLDFVTLPVPFEWNSFDIALNSDVGAPLLVYIDNVRVNPAVPEPSTLVVCGLGLVGLSAVRMRRRK